VLCILIASPYFLRMPRKEIIKSLVPFFGPSAPAPEETYISIYYSYVIKYACIVIINISVHHLAAFWLRLSLNNIN